MSTAGGTGGWGTRFERIAAWGFDGVELRVHELSDLDAYRELRRCLAQLGLEATVAGSKAGSASLERYVCELVDACALLDAHVLCGPFPFTSDRAGTALLARVAAYAGSFGVILALGGRDGRAEPRAPTVAETSRLVDAVGSPHLGVLYNTYQAHVEEPSISSAVLAAGARLRHVQIAENDGAVPGGGQVRWSETFAALDAIRYDGWYVVEARDDAEGSALEALRFLRRNRHRVRPAECGVVSQLSDRG